jgi:hypothetical protein
MVKRRSQSLIKKPIRFTMLDKEAYYFKRKDGFFAVCTLKNDGPRMQAMRRCWDEEEVSRGTRGEKKWK